MGESTAEWRFLREENLDPKIAGELASPTITVDRVLDVLFEVSDDVEDILPYCRETNAGLVTNTVRDCNATDLEIDDHPGIGIVHDKHRPTRSPPNCGISSKHTGAGTYFAASKAPTTGRESERTIARDRTDAASTRDT